MIGVSYEHELDYLRDPQSGNPFPGLWIVVRDIGANRELEVQAHLDSGAERSLFDGQIGKAIGLELGTGDALHFRSPLARR